MAKAKVITVGTRVSINFQEQGLEVAAEVSSIRTTKNGEKCLNFVANGAYSKTLAKEKKCFFPKTVGNSTTFGIKETDLATLDTKVLS